MAFKDHDGVLPGARLGVGWKGLGGSELGYDATRTIPGTDPYGGGQVTTALTGTTEGTLTYDLTNAEHPADATDLIVEVDAVDADPGYFGFSNRVFCPLG
jgi:hypothetical protein